MPLIVDKLISMKVNLEQYESIKFYFCTSKQSTTIKSNVGS